MIGFLLFLLYVILLAGAIYSRSFPKTFILDVCVTSLHVLALLFALLIWLNEPYYASFEEQWGGDRCEVIHYRPALIIPLAYSAILFTLSFILRVDFKNRIHKTVFIIKLITCLLTCAFLVLLGTHHSTPEERHQILQRVGYHG